MKIIFLLLMLAVGFVAFVFFLESKSVFYPSKDLAHTPQDADLPFEEVVLPLGDDRIHAWLVSRAGRRQTVLFFHGNGGNIGDRLDKLLLFDRIGLNVFIIDYRGYGKSTGRPSEKGLYQEAEAAYNYLVENRSVNPESIFVYGESLGGAVAVDVASKQTVGGLIIDSSFSSARDMAKYIYPFIPGFLVRIKLDSIGKIKKATAPKLFFHSRADRTVPFDLGQKLYQAAEGEKKFVEILGGHNDGYMYSKEILYEEIKQFVSSKVKR